MTRAASDRLPTPSVPLLAVEQVDKAFPGVQALQGVSLELQAGEVLALLGENGAGKSTLIKLLAGIHAPDAGSLRIAGQPHTRFTPDTARAAGIAVIHQEFQLVPALNAVDNIFLGREPRPWHWLDRRREVREVESLLEQLRAPLNVRIPCRHLSVAQQQMVEIAKALSHQARILIMDEPTAALTPQEVEALLQTVKELRSQGIGIIYISHRLDEIFEISQRITVLRDGRHVATQPTQAVSRRQLIEWMVGRDLEHEFPPRDAPAESTDPPVRLQVSGLTRQPAVRDVSFSLHRGEILGLTGLVGAGRTEVVRLLFGADRPDAGQITLDGQVLHLRGPRDAIRAGICLLTEDRKQQGLLLNRSLTENFGLPNLSHFAQCGLLAYGLERKHFLEFAQSLQIRMASPNQSARSLSGGNQQKVVLAKWLESQSEIIIFDEPTRGIDVGAKFEIYQLMKDLARRGKSILMVSSELTEVLGMADRILVMHEGRITGEIRDVPRATQAQILELAVR